MSFDDVEDDRDPKEIEREEYDDRTNNFDFSVERRAKLDASAVATSGASVVTPERNAL